MNEDALVRRIGQGFGPARGKPLALGLGDDAALWSPARGHQTVLTCDWFLEGTHFLLNKHPADSVAWKCLARGVSDLAAMGGKPRCFLLSLALPTNLTGKWLDKFLWGLRRASTAFRCDLAGGDTTCYNKILISVTAIGEVPKHRAILRSGARPGDFLFVSGRLGEADLGLRQLLKQRGLARATTAALRKHLYPEPRLALGQWLAANRLASAMMDVSDGLSTDLPRLCAASHVGARIDANSFSLSHLAGANDARELTLHGGDDYELLFTVKPGNLRRVPRQVHGLPLTRIGTITRDLRILVLEGRRALPLRTGGWDPFRKP